MERVTPPHADPKTCKHPHKDCIEVGRRYDEGRLMIEYRCYCPDCGKDWNEERKGKYK